MTMQDHILIVDDDAEIRGLLGDYLRKQGYRATAVADGKGMRAVIEKSRPDVIVLDLMLPGEDGLDLCRAVRARSNIPIIMLTARVKSVLRRARSLPDNLKPPATGTYRFAGWTLDTATRNLTAPDRVVIPLSGTEFRLLRVFLDHPNRVLARDQLIDLMLARDAGPFDRAIDVQVSRLRQRLREDAKEPAIIKTVRGQGYVFATQVDAAS